MYRQVIRGGLTVIVAVSSLAGPTAFAQEECQMPRPTILGRGISSVVGDGPVWIGSLRPSVLGPEGLQWAALPQETHVLLVVRAATTERAITISGRSRRTGAVVRLGQADSTMRSERLMLHGPGVQLATASPMDRLQYRFFPVEALFPERGCYEIAIDVGGEQSVINLWVQEQ